MTELRVLVERFLEQAGWQARFTQMHIGSYVKNWSDYGCRRECLKQDLQGFSANRHHLLQSTN